MGYPYSSLRLAMTMATSGVEAANQDGCLNMLATAGNTRA